MSKRDTMIRALCKSLGVDYRVTTIDLERVIYRDFGNGFNVEISGMHTSSMKKSLVFMRRFTVDEEAEYARCKTEALAEVTALHQAELDSFENAIAIADSLTDSLKDDLKDAHARLKQAKKDKKNTSSIEVEIATIKQEQVDNKANKKKAEKELKDLKKKISEEVKPVIKKKFDYDIPIAKVDDAGITTTGAASEGNQLPQLVDEYLTYRTQNNLWSDKHLAYEYYQNNKWILRKGDFLITRTNGSKDLVGKSAVFDSDDVYTYASYLIRYRFDTSIVLPEYVNILFMTPLVREQIAVMRRQGGGQYNLNSDEIGAIRIPVPSIPIQQDIVKRFNDAKDGAKVYYGKADECKTNALKNFEKEIFL